MNEINYTTAVQKMQVNLKIIGVFKASTVLAILFDIPKEKTMEDIMYLFDKKIQEATQ